MLNLVPSIHQSSCGNSMLIRLFRMLSAFFLICLLHNLTLSPSRLACPSHRLCVGSIQSWVVLWMGCCTTNYVILLLSYCHSATKMCSDEETNWNPLIKKHTIHTGNYFYLAIMSYCNYYIVQLT